MKEAKNKKAKDDNEDDTTPANHAKKNTDHTVFVRFVPPSSLLRRHHMEQYFSQIGPIKKASLIIPKATTKESSSGSKSSYGFIKYTCKADADAAAKQLHKSTFNLPSDAVAESTYSNSTEPTTFQVMVELASNITNQKQQQSKGNKDDAATDDNNKDTSAATAAALLEAKKKQNRVMVKNLSFYAKESHIQAALEPYGKLVEVHIPKVQGKSRGFAFCTFDQKTQAQAAIDAAAAVGNKGKGVLIKQRKVQVDWSMSKKLHQQQQEKADKAKRKQDYQTQVKEELKREQGYQGGGKQQQDGNDDDDASSSSGDDDDDNDDNSSSSSSSSEEDDEDKKKEEGDDDSDEDMEEEEEEENLETDENHDVKEEKHDTREDKQKAIQEQRELFIRNLPFDATRHDVFETFRSFGTIQAIYIVLNPHTKLPRGTCFVTFATTAGAARAMKQAGGNKYDKDNPMASLVASSGILCKNRPLLVDYAVEKEVAMTLKKDPSSEEKSNPGRDKRNIYLKGIGRVDDEKEWESLLESDRNKRERAWSDKITKLKSPLFFINPFRLSIRNISKAVDEGTLKKILFDATQRGLERKLVKTEDLISHWRASGEFTPREILEKTKEHQANKDNNVLSVDSLDEKNTKRTIPSVYLDRDFDAKNAGSSSAADGGGSGAKKAAAPSRGFAFAEFTHHVHAMACLRELNNNPVYSEEFAAGGKGAAAKANAAKKRRHKKKRKTLTQDGDDEEGGAVKIPRLIVEFTVENKAKARQQAEHRAQQQANRLKQKMETRERRELASSMSASGEKNAEGAGGKKPNKLGRGAKQREKKRQRRLEGEDGDGDADGASPVDKAEAQKRKFRQPEGGEDTADSGVVPIAKAIKPPKKQKKKREREELEVEEKFSKLVDKYKAAFAGAGVEDGDDAKATAATAKSKNLESGKRWFE